MARTFKNVTTGVVVTPSNDRVAAMYADHPSWEEIRKVKKGKNAEPKEG